MMIRQSILKRLSTPEDLDELMHITSPRGWLALLALAGLLIAGIVWSMVTTVSTTVSGRGALAAGPGGAGRLQAVVFVPLDRGREVRPGMRARVMVADPAGAPQAALSGTVVSVDPAPANERDMLRVVGNAAYVQMLAASGELIPVQVAARGPGWTVGGNGAAGLKQGMILNGVITLNEQQLIHLVIP